MTAVRIGGRAGAVADVTGVEGGRYPLGQIEAGAELFRELHDSDRAVGAGDHEPSLSKLDVSGRGFEHVGCDLLALIDYLGGRLHDGGAAVHDRFRAAGAAAREQLVAVALEEADAFKRNPEFVAQDLREGGGMTLSVIERAGDDGDRAIGFEADAAHLLARRRGDFEEAANPKPAHLSAFAALAFAAGGAPLVWGLRRGVGRAGGDPPVLRVFPGPPCWDVSP